MYVPFWLGYLSLFGFAIILVALAITLLCYMGEALLDHIIPRLWYYFVSRKLSRMSPETFEEYIARLQEEYYIVQGKGEGNDEEDDR